MKSAKQKERELIIKLGGEKKTVREISSILGTSKSKASFWISRYKKTKNLADKPRSGRPTALTENDLKSISDSLKAKLLEPRSARAGIITKEVIPLIEAKAKKKYTLRHVQRLMHRMGFSLVIPRVSHIRKDEKAQQKFREEFKKKPSRNIWTIQS